MSFSDGPADVRPTAPAMPAQSAFDPDNPQAQGYDLNSEAFRAARAAAAERPALAAALSVQLSRERARFRAWCDAYRRSGAGGCGTGLGPGPFEPADPARLLAWAIGAASAAELGAASPLAELATALAEVEDATKAVCTALSETRSAIDRRDGFAFGRAAAAATLAGRLEAAAQRLSMRS